MLSIPQAAARRAGRAARGSETPTEIEHVSANSTHRSIEAAKIIGGVARIVRDVGLAEELAQDALVSALERWPQSGVPDNPGAWLMTTAKNRAFDRLRHAKLAESKHEQLGYEMEIAQQT